MSLFSGLGLADGTHSLRKRLAPIAKKAGGHSFAAHEPGFSHRAASPGHNAGGKPTLFGKHAKILLRDSDADLIRRQVPPENRAHDAPEVGFKAPIVQCSSNSVVCRPFQARQDINCNVEFVHQDGLGHASSLDKESWNGPVRGE
jgi:hypothetical protein